MPLPSPVLKPRGGQIGRRLPRQVEEKLRSSIKPKKRCFGRETEVTVAPGDSQVLRAPSGLQDQRFGNPAPGLVLSVIVINVNKVAQCEQVQMKLLTSLLLLRGSLGPLA